MAPAWMHSDGAVGEESLSRVPRLSIRKQNQSGNCTVAVSGVWRSRFWPDDRQYLFGYLVFAESFHRLVFLPVPLTRTGPRVISALLLGNRLGCTSLEFSQEGGGRKRAGAKPTLHPPPPHPPGSQVSRGHL